MNARPRIAAALALALGVLAFALAAVIVIDSFPSGLIAAALVLASTIGGWYLIVGPLPARLLGGASVAATLIAAVLLVAGEHLVELLVLIGSVVLCCLAARLAFGFRADLPPAAAPKRAVLFFNPLSGGGKAERLGLADAARSRGIRAVELGPGDDLENLVRTAVQDGADALAMAGGDGSQAIVAAAAAAADLPYACIPAANVTMSSARSTRSSTAASGVSTSPRSTAASSSTTSHSGSTPRPFSVPATATRS